MITVRFKNTFRERLPEWVTSLALVLWGIIVLSEPPELWQMQYFSVLANYASQATWGAVATMLGTCRLVALGINGAWRPTGHIRAVGALLGVLVWSSIIMSYITLDWSPPALATKTAMLLLDLTALWYAAADAKRADIKAKNKALTSSV